MWRGRVCLSVIYPLAADHRLMRLEPNPGSSITGFAVVEIKVESGV